MENDLEHYADHRVGDLCCDRCNRIREGFKMGFEDVDKCRMCGEETYINEYKLCLSCDTEEIDRMSDARFGDWPQ
jgi:hypothetical protein